MTIQEQDGRAVLQPQGELTIFEAGEFRQAFLTLSEKKGQRELNLDAVARMDSSCVQLVIAACQNMSLQITHVSPTIQKQFEVVGCAQFVNGAGEPEQ